MFEVFVGERKAVLAVAAFIIFVVYLVGVVLYRLYLSPLAKFPGPKLAAVTYLYELYYDIIKRGKYTFKIRDLHAKYGPIIRISPNELHIHDPDHYDNLFSHKGRWEKNPFYTNALGNARLSGFGTVDHDHHRLRRAAINPFFSKQKVTALQPVIQRLVDKLCKKLEAQRGTDDVVPIEYAFDAFTMDVITEYSLVTSFGYLDKPGWSGDFREMERGFGQMSYMQKLFPPLLRIVESLPDWLVIWMDPRTKLMLEFFQNCHSIAKTMINEEDGKKYEEKPHPTIFYDIIHSDLPAAEKTPARLEGEVSAILGAGAATTAWTMSVTMYHLAVQPKKLERLQAEIRSIMPDPFQPAKLQELERLPYLTAVIMESLRVANSVPSRTARTAPDRSIYFRDWEIPKGTPVGMTSALIHLDPNVFEHPLEFLPERWLDPKERQRLERFLVPFSKGTRSCAGMNLAWAEMYMTIASVCTRVHLELFETTREDVDLYSDMIIAEPKNYTNGIKFRVR